MIVDIEGDGAVLEFFDEKVDGNSVSAADFTVEGASPIAAEVVSDEPTKVYLTLGADLLADDEPVVAIASGGSVSDKAGNSLNVGQMTADDKIAPTFTVTLDTTLTTDVSAIQSPLRPLPLPLSLNQRL